MDLPRIKKKAGPERTEVLQVATMEESLSLYTALIPHKKVFTKLVLGIGIECPGFPLQTPDKKLLRWMMQGTDVWLQQDISEPQPLILHWLWRKPRKVILLANTAKGSRLGWKDSCILRWEHRFNFPVFQYQIFFTKTLTYFIKTFRAPQRKSTVKTKPSLLP